MLTIIAQNSEDAKLKTSLGNSDRTQSSDLGSRGKNQILHLEVDYYNILQNTELDLTLW